MKRPCVRLMCASVLVALLGLNLPSVAGGEQPPQAETLESRIVDYLRHPPRHTTPYGEIQAFGSAAPPILRRLLEEPEFEASQAHILTLLGHLGDATDTHRIEAFIFEKYSGEITDAQLRKVLSALLALGPLSDNDPRALKLLANCANPEYFRDIRFTTSGRDSAYLRVLLSQIAINAIGFSRRAEAESLLATLASQPYDELQVGNVKDAMERHGAIKRVGRENHVEEMLRARGEARGDKRNY